MDNKPIEFKEIGEFMKRKKHSRTPMKESAVPHPGQAPVGPDNSIMMQALQLAQAGELGEVEGLNFLGAAAQAQAATNTPKPRKRGPRPSRKKQAALHEKAMFEALGLADAAGEDLEDTRDVNTLNREFLEQGAAEQL